MPRRTNFPSSNPTLPLCFVVTILALWLIPAVPAFAKPPNQGREYDLDALAAVAHLSKYHFSSRYKALTGYSPIKHFLHMKIEYACQLLDSSEMSVKAISAELGYPDPLYFSRLFSKTIGMSPRAYRNSVRK